MIPLPPTGAPERAAFDKWFTAECEAGRLNVGLSLLPAWHAWAYVWPVAHDSGVKEMANCLRLILDGENCEASIPAELAEVAELRRVAVMAIQGLKRR